MKSSKFVLVQLLLLLLPKMLVTGNIFPDLDNLRLPSVSLEVDVEVAKISECMNIINQFPPKGYELEGMEKKT